MNEGLLCYCGQAAVYVPNYGVYQCRACRYQTTVCGCQAGSLDISLLGLSMSGQDGTLRLVKDWQEG
jgi:hypothetical protein